MSNDSTNTPSGALPGPEAANDGPPVVDFKDDKFKVLIGLDSDAAGNIRMRAAVSDGVNQDDMSEPAVFSAFWLVENWDSLRNMIAREYNLRQKHAMDLQKPGLQLIDTSGAPLQ